MQPEEHLQHHLKFIKLIQMHSALPFTDHTIKTKLLTDNNNKETKSLMSREHTLEKLNGGRIWVLITCGTSWHWRGKHSRNVFVRILIIIYIFLIWNVVHFLSQKSYWILISFNCNKSWNGINLLSNIFSLNFWSVCIYNTQYNLIFYGTIVIINNNNKWSIEKRTQKESQRRQNGVKNNKGAHTTSTLNQPRIHSIQKNLSKFVWTYREYREIW